MGRIIPYIMENKNSSKPPTSYCQLSTPNLIIRKLPSFFNLNNWDCNTQKMELIWLFLRECLQREERALDLSTAGGFTSRKIMYQMYSNVGIKSNMSSAPPELRIIYNYIYINNHTFSFVTVNLCLNGIWKII